MWSLSSVVLAQMPASYIGLDGKGVRRKVGWSSQKVLDGLGHRTDCGTGLGFFWKDRLYPLGPFPGLTQTS